MSFLSSRSEPTSSSSTLRRNRRSILKTPWPALRAYGTSSLYDGLLYSMEKVEKSERPRKALIVFTDGNDNGEQHRPRPCCAGSAELSRIAVFRRHRLAGPGRFANLESLSELSGGRTLYVPKQEAVSPVLEQIRNELCAAVLSRLLRPAPSRFPSHSRRSSRAGPEDSCQNRLHAANANSRSQTRKTCFGPGFVIAIPLGFERWSSIL